MADDITSFPIPARKVSERAPAGALTGSEVLAILQSGSKKVLLSALAAFINKVPSGGAPGQVLKKASSSDYDTVWAAESVGGGGGGGGWTLINSVTAGAGGAAALTISSIPNTYNELRLVYTGRSDGATYLTQLRVTCNGDTNSSNYTSQMMRGNASDFACSTSGVQHLCLLSGASGLSSRHANSAIIHVPNYASTAFSKVFLTRSGGQTGSGSYSTLSDVSTMMWDKSTPEAITQLSLTCGYGSHIQGSTFRLYGM